MCCIPEIKTCEEASLCVNAAAMHDYDHPGLSNDYLIKSRHKLAILYNDVSPLEMSHVSTFSPVFHCSCIGI